MPSASASKTAVGWTIGAGFEFGLTKNISAKAEYLYFDLGSDTYNLGEPVAINRSGAGLGSAPRDFSSGARRAAALRQKLWGGRRGGGTIVAGCS
ncbi:MAG: outer membrane protein [Methylocella sp.]